MTNPHHHITYVELPATDLMAIKTFYGSVFGWSFRDWGSSYASFSGGGLDGGFTTEATVTPDGPLVVLYPDDLEASVQAVVAGGGTISQPIFTFPGGRRFHFIDPSGNQLGVWGEDPDETAA